MVISEFSVKKFALPTAMIDSKRNKPHSLTPLGRMPSILVPRAVSVSHTT